MKIKLTFFLALAFGTQVHGQQLQTLFSWSVFNNPTDKPYVEVYLTIGGQSVTYAPISASTTKQASVKALLSVTLGEKLIYADKYNILSPTITDSSQKKDFINQHRFPIANGTYSISLELEDNNDSTNNLIIADKLVVNYTDSVAISDITFLESYKKTEAENQFTKNGIELIPYNNNVYLTEQNTLRFYTEVYNADKRLNGEPFIISYSVQNFENENKVSTLSRFSRQQAKNIAVIISEFPLTELPSGNYNLLIEVLSKNNELIASKTAFFQRVNKNYTPKLEDITTTNTQNTFVSTLNEQELTEYIKSLFPISSQAEIQYQKTILADKNTARMQQFFLYFWQKRNPQNPEEAWAKYLVRVKDAQQQFGTQLNRGYETDRGRVFLQYGAPSFINKSEFDRNTWPYEIWQYNITGRQNNRTFVFSLADKGLSTDDYELIHSDAFGEINNPRWQNDLQKRRQTTQQLDRNDPNSTRKQYFGEDNLKRDSDF